MGYTTDVIFERIRSRRTLLALAAAILLLNACAKNDDPTLTNLWDDSFKNCATNCHAPGAADGSGDGPDLSTKAGFYNNLVNKTVNDNYPGWIGSRAGNCNSYPFISPGSAAGSTLPAALIESYSSSFSTDHRGCTTSLNYHVQNNVSISSGTQEMLVKWIDGGAKND